MSRALGLLLTNLIAGEGLRADPHDGCALASSVRAWLRPARAHQPAAPPIGCLLRSHPDLAERLARGLESDRPAAPALRAAERLLGDVQPRLDDLRRVVFLLEAA